MAGNESEYLSELALTGSGRAQLEAFVEGVWFSVSIEGRSRAEVGIPDLADAC